MANNKNKKNNNKKPKKKSKVWAEIKFFLTSLFSNDRCVEARNKPWYAAIIIGILSVMVATVPVTVNYFKRDGAQFLDAPSQGLEISLADFQQTIAGKDLSMKVDENHHLVIDNDKWSNTWAELNTARKEYYPTITKSSSKFYTHWYLKETTKDWRNGEMGDAVELSTKKEEVVDLAVYWIDKTGNDFDTEVNNYLKNSDPNGNAKYSINAIFFGPEKYIACKGKGDNNGLLSSIGCNYNYTPVGADLKDLVKQTTHGTTNKVIYDATKENGGLTENNYTTYINQTLDSWKEIFHDGWEDTRLREGWMWTGIGAGIFAGMVLLLGFIIWLVTRGKRNPLHSFTIWQCQKIAYWSAVTPALLGLLGLWMTQFALLGFIFFFGMRIMWMSMRSLRPIGGQQ